MPEESIIKNDELVLITGASGFIGSEVVRCLLEKGYHNLRFLVRPSSDLTKFYTLQTDYPETNIHIIRGNLVSIEDCKKATEGVSMVYHLAAGRGGKSYPDAYLNSVVTTRNLIESIGTHHQVKRVLCVSSFTVYSPMKLNSRTVLDERTEIDDAPHLRGEPYCYAKVRQEQLFTELCNNKSIPFVIVRPGAVYGPGNKGITGRVGIDTFGVFIHLGGSNPIPLSYITNCAEAIVLAGLTRGIDGEVFNILDDDMPASRDFLQLYKNNVKQFRSIYLPKFASYMFCSIWEWYSKWSRGQLPPVFNRRRWHADWGGAKYSNAKLKKFTGWRQRVPFSKAIDSYFQSERESGASL